MQETCGINSESEGKSFAAFNNPQAFLTLDRVFSLDFEFFAPSIVILQGLMFSLPRYLGTKRLACESVRRWEYPD